MILGIVFVKTYFNKNKYCGEKLFEIYFSPIYAIKDNDSNYTDI